MQDDFPRVFEAVGAELSAATLREAFQRAERLSHPRFDDLDSILWCESKRNLELRAAYIVRHAASYA